jgi:hypothetical protein
MLEAAKAKYIEGLSKQASTEYDKILTRYPMMDRADDARKRLAALHQPIPRPTKGAVAQNKAEIASRSESSTVQKMLGLVKKGPDVSQAAHTGEPALVAKDPVPPTEIVKGETQAALGMPDKGDKTVGVEVLNGKQPGSGDVPPEAGNSAGNGSPFGAAASGGAQPATATPDPNELKPSAPPDPNELKPTDTGADPSLPPPTQVNEIQQGQSATAQSDASAPASDADLSSSKKKKKGLKKIVPF